MKMFKKIILSALCACCALIAGVATVGLNKEIKTANAAVATEYTAVDTAMMMKLENVYEGNGNFNIYVTLPQYDTTETRDCVQFAGVDLADVFDGFGFFDSVKIGEKTLRELGCTQFYNNQIAFGVGEPKNVVKLYLHADPETWMTAFNNGEIVFGDNQTPVTIGEGTVIPGYSYLNGDDDAVVYRADMTYVTKRSTGLTYDYFTAGQTEIDSVKYVQGHDGVCGYFGVSFVGDDYATDGTQEVFLEDYKHGFNNLIPDSFVKKILVNGESGQVDYYSLLNLGEAGKGYFSFVIRVHEDDVETVTIPKGSYFPSYVMKGLRQQNGGNLVYMGYATTEDMTFYKNENGEYVTFDGYAEDKVAELNDYLAAKLLEEYFESDVVAMNEAIATAETAINAANSLSEIDFAFNEAIAFMDGVMTELDFKSEAFNELDMYKVHEFRAEEKALRAEMVRAAEESIFLADTKEGVEDALAAAKAEIDTLKTAAEYADEELAEDKAAAIEEINGYLADVAYLAEQKAERAAAVDAGLAAVAAAKDLTEIAQAVADVKTAVDALTTKATIVDAAKAEVEAYKADKVYRAEQAEERAAAIATAKTALDNAVCQADVDEAVATAKATIDALKTDLELLEEEKAAADALYGEEKATALAKINELKASVIYDEYTAENQAVINELYRVAKKAVAEALTEEEIVAAAEAFETELAKVSKIEKVELPPCEMPDDTSDDLVEEPQVNNPFGCQSSVGFTGIVGVLALGAAVLFRKKKEN